VSLPELRCLLCDRVLLDETTALPSERCQQCGKLMRLEGPPPLPPMVPPGEQAGFTPGEGSLLTTPFDELPEAVPVVLPRSAPKILKPVVTPVDIPVVQPRVVPPPPPKPKWVPPVQSHPPVPPHEDEIDRPKPKFGCALVVVLGFLLLGVVAVTFIVYAIARGLRKPPKTDPTPMKVVSEATSVKPGPDKTKLDPALVPMPVSSLWVPPTGAYPLDAAKANDTATATLILPSKSPYGVVAGGGRFILFPLHESQLIALFDVGTAKYAGFLPMPDPAALVAASSNEAYLFSPASRKLQRYSLHTLDAERTVVWNAELGEPRAIVAGHAARGPIYLLASNPSGAILRLLDIETLEPIAWKPGDAPFEKPNGVFTGGLAGDHYYLRASADGRTVVGGVAKGTQNYRADRLELSGPNPRIAPTGVSIARPAFPTADGGMTAFAVNPKNTRFPMVAGNGYFEITGKTGNKALAMTFDGGDGHVQRAEVNDIADFAANDGPDQDRRAFFIPGSRAFVHLGADGRSIHWKRVVISEELRKPSQDFLVIAGAPPAFAVRGGSMQYEPAILSNVGESSIKLETYPPGMKVEGKSIVWPVPANTLTADVTVEFSIESKLKPEVAAKQRFTLTLLAKSPASMKWVAPEAKHPAPPRKVKAGLPGDKLAFVGEPKTTVARFETYRTTIKLTTPEDAEVTILAAPAGAKWDGDDLVWTVPPADNLIGVPVVIAATTKSGGRTILGYLLDFR